MVPRDLLLSRLDRLNSSPPKRLISSEGGVTMLNIAIRNLAYPFWRPEISLHFHVRRRTSQEGSPLCTRSGLQMLCPICSKEVALENANTDESGTAIHGDCYLLKLKLKQASSEK